MAVTGGVSAERRRVDMALVRSAQSGDHEAFRVLVDGSIDRLFAIASLILRDRSLAEDAVQDALLRAWRDLPRLRERDRFEAWLARLAVNATHDVLRRRRHVRELRPLDDADARAADDSGRVVDRVVLAHAYGRLSAPLRAVVVLHYYVGLPLDEVAAILDIPPGTARSRQHAALESMRRWMREPGADGALPAESLR